MLLEAADMLAGEQVSDVDNGQRFETYTIAGERGTGEFKINGAAARLVHRGDTIIVISYAHHGASEIPGYAPRVVHLDANNRMVDVDECVDVLVTRDTGGHA